MDIECNCRYDEGAMKRFAGKVFDRIARPLAVFYGAIILMLLAVEVVQVACGKGLDGFVLGFVPVFTPLLVFKWVRSRMRYQKTVVSLMSRRMGGKGEATVKMTDDFYESRVDADVMRFGWRRLGSHYLFVDGGVAVTEGRNPTLFVNSLAELGIEASDLKDVLERAGLKDFRLYRDRSWVATLLFVLFVLLGVFVSASKFFPAKSHNDQPACELLENPAVDVEK